MSTSSPADETDAVIRSAGLRATGTRRAVLDVVHGMPHARADEVFDRVRASLPGTSLQSVYNALGDFVEAGLVRRIEPAGHPGLFERHLDDNHHHVVCTSCGRIDDVPCVEGAAPCLHPADVRGFEIHTAEVTFWGMCADCASTR